MEKKKIKNKANSIKITLEQSLKDHKEALKSIKKGTNNHKKTIDDLIDNEQKVIDKLNKIIIELE